MPYATIALPYGGDFSFSPQGSLAVVADTTQDAPASLQLLEFILFTNPQVQDAYGNVLARGDSLQYPTFGAGIAGYVDSLATSDKIAALQATILNQMLQFPNFLQNPAPVITVQITGTTTLTVQVNFTCNTGLPIASPAYPISVGS